MIANKYLITLSNLPRIGRKSLLAIIDNLDYEICDYKEIIDVIAETKKVYTRIKIPSETDLEQAINKSESILQDCEKKAINITSVYNNKYPKRFLELDSDRPPILYSLGSLEAANKSLSVAIIGTREPTEWGYRAGEQVAKRFTENGFVVVSGLAKGCDTAGHQGCLNSNGISVAVLANGLDEIYPKENKQLAMNIIDSGGCIISEYAPKTQPQKNFFIERNRLQSGLSQAIVVIESAIKGGSMHTVGFAKKQKRRIGCLHGHPSKFSTENSLQGTQMLIKEGAFKLATKEELNSFIDLLVKESVSTFGK